MTTIKNVSEEENKRTTTTTTTKKHLRNLIGFLSANKIDNCNRVGGRGEKTPKESTE